MLINYRNYPHPVLSHFSDDIVGCAFQSTILTNITKNTYLLNIIAKTSSKDIVDLIDANKAKYTLHVECGSTRYRQIFSSPDSTFSAEIPADYLDGKVQLCSLVVATDNIQNYKNSNFHKDYDGMSFNVNKGDVLAVGRDSYFFAEKEIDPLRNIPSIFTVTSNKDEDPAPFDIDPSGQKIVIRLSPENFEKYRYLSQDQELQITLATLIVLPSLVSILEMLMSSSETAEGSLQYEECRWYRVLCNKLKSLNIDINQPDWGDSSLVIAQKLIGDPLTSTLAMLESYTEDE